MSYAKKNQIEGLIERGAIRPPLDIEGTYKGTRLRARIERDGQILFKGRRFMSASMAASMARLSAGGKSAIGRYQHSNGWSFWHFYDERGELQPLSVLRRRR